MSTFDSTVWAKACPGKNYRLDDEGPFFKDRECAELKCGKWKCTSTAKIFVGGTGHVMLKMKRDIKVPAKGKDREWLEELEARLKTECGAARV
jgi:hypothetical protein